MDGLIVSHLLGKLDGVRRPPTFLQIGAHDGVANDPISDIVRQCGWRGVLVEPVEYLFRRLVANYAGHPGVSFENCAVAPERGERIFYRMRELERPPILCYDQLGSFNRDVILKHRQFLPDIESYIVEQPVPCKTIDDIVAAHGLADLDLIVIDTEGFDYEVLKLIDFARLHPCLVYYENAHLQPGDADRAMGLLAEHDYFPLALGENTLAIRRGFVPDEDLVFLIKVKERGDAIAKEGRDVRELLEQTGIFMSSRNGPHLSLKRIGALPA